MIKLYIRTLYKGNAGIRDKYVKEAIKTDQSIAVKLSSNGQKMLIVDPKKYAYKSTVAFKDKYSGESHFLYYYKWTPGIAPVEDNKATIPLF